MSSGVTSGEAGQLSFLVAPSLWRMSMTLAGPQVWAMGTFSAVRSLVPHGPNSPWYSRKPLLDLRRGAAALEPHGRQGMGRRDEVGPCLTVQDLSL